MKFFQYIIRVLCITFVLLTHVSVLNAETISFTDSFNLSDSVNSGANTTGSFTDSLNRTQGISLSRFDPNLGVLNSYTVEFYGVQQYSIGNANFRDDDWANETKGLQRIQSMQVSINMAGANYSRTRSTRSSTCSDTGPLTGGASCSTSISGSTISFSGQQTSIFSPVSLANVTGLGTINSTVFQYGSMYTTETDGDDGYVNSRYGLLRTTGNVRITYEYTAVPVPAAAWLFGTALVGMVTLAKRKRA